MDDLNVPLITAIATIVNIAVDLIDSSSEEENVLEKNEHYFEITVQNFNDKEFQQHFRINKTTLEILLQDMNAGDNLYAMCKILTWTKFVLVVNVNGNLGRKKMSVQKQLLITLWYLGNRECYRSVACRFGIGKHCCWYTVSNICQQLILLNRNKRYLSFPRNREAIEIIREYENINGFPGIIGAIDGCHIEIEKPNINGNSYINRKRYPSVLLQGICDSKKIFLDVYAGEPGSIHDQRLFYKSDFYRKLRDHEITFPNNSCLIGDLAYRLSANLIVGFKNNGHWTPAEINFNQLLNRNRVCIENAFGLLKGRWRRLKHIETKRMDLIPQIIVAACILHNICLKNDDIININDSQFEEVPVAEEEVPIEEEEELLEIESGRMKRRNIMNQVLVRNMF